MSAMTERHREHLEFVQRHIARRLSEKYVAGVKEYGGTHLTDMPLLDLLENAFDEAVDASVYLSEAIRQVRLSQGLEP